MTPDEFGAQIEELQAALGRKLSEKQKAVYYRHLRDIPGERWRTGVEYAIQEGEDRFMPTPGRLRKYCREALGEGVPNAGAYQETGRQESSPLSEHDLFLCWRQMQLEAMGEEEYRHYLHDEHDRAKQEHDWRQRWSSGERDFPPITRRPRKAEAARA